MPFLSGVFQSTHPQGVGPKSSEEQTIRTHFNPPTRKGWDVDLNIYGGIVAISIHPPARGGTTSLFLRAQTALNFNPPTRKGWDLGVFFCKCHLFISIHPPARGGTQRQSFLANGFEISIHPPARGGTSTASSESSASSFQSTHPQGVGLGLGAVGDRVGLISIHPPARGGTI